MNILHLICSPRGHASHSAAYSRHLVDRLASIRTGSQVSIRCLNAMSIPHVDREFSLASRANLRPPSVAGSLELSDELISELVASDAIVLATPMHNLAIPSSLKAWIDHVVRPDVTFRYHERRMVGLPADRPVFIVLSSSQSFWQDDEIDFLRPYVLAMFGAMGILSVEFFALDRKLNGP